MFAWVVSVAVPGCGGGSGYEGPTTPSVSASGALAVAGWPSLMLAPVELRQLDITGGQPPYAVTSQNTALVLATVSASTLKIAGVQASSAPVTVQVSDSATPKRTVTLAVTVTNTPAQGDMAFLPDRVTLIPGGSATVALYGGTPPFTVEPLSRSHVAASVLGRTLTVTGLLEAVDSQVRVTDSLALVRMLSVTVAAPVGTVSGVALFSNLPQPLSLPFGVTRAYTLGGGTGPYTVTSSNPAVLLPSLRGNLLSLTTGVAGTVSLKISDSTPDGQLWHSVTVQSAVAPLALSMPIVSAAVGAQKTVAIVGGRPPYQVVFDGSGVVTGSVNGSTLALAPLAPGSGVVTVYDSAGAAVNLTVVATGLALPTKFGLSPAKVVISEQLVVGTNGLPQQTTIVFSLGKATAPVQVFSSAPQLLMPTVVGNTVEVRTPGSVFNPRPPCVDATTTVTITAIDASGESAASDVVVTDAGACSG